MVRIEVGFGGATDARKLGKKLKEQIEGLQRAGKQGSKQAGILLKARKEKICYVPYLYLPK